MTSWKLRQMISGLCRGCSANCKVSWNVNTGFVMFRLYSKAIWRSHQCCCWIKPVIFLIQDLDIGTKGNFRESRGDGGNFIYLSFISWDKCLMHKIIQLVILPWEVLGLPAASDWDNYTYIYISQLEWETQGQLHRTQDSASPKDRLQSRSVTTSPSVTVAVLFAEKLSSKSQTLRSFAVESASVGAECPPSLGDLRCFAVEREPLFPAQAQRPGKGHPSRTCMSLAFVVSKETGPQSLSQFRHWPYTDPALHWNVS